MMIPDITQIENDLLRRTIFCIVYPPLWFVLAIRNIFVYSGKFFHDLYKGTIYECCDIWKKSPYRRNDRIWPSDD